MKFRSLMTAICVLAAAHIASAAPFAYIANTGTRNVSIIDTAITPNPLAVPPGSNAITATVTLPDDNADPNLHPNAYAITVGASGQYVYVGLKDTNEVNIIDAATNTVLMNRRITLGADIPGGLAVNAAETRLYVTSNMSNTLIVIDISSGAREVGRVALHDSAASNPEGVVLNAAGTKAYVANSTQDSITVVATDETNNLYTRSSIIPLGTGAWPMGLALSSDGAKLYFASMSGNTGVVNTSTNAVATLPTDNGNLSIAINPVGGAVYAPSFVMDLLFGFDSAGVTLSGSPYANATGPKGVSVTPSGLKLYVAMNLDDKVKVFDTASLITTPVSASIALPTGAKPTNLGNFIGPATPFTIAASAGAGCTITPTGTVPVTSHGWTFGISGDGCKVLVNSVDVGYPTSYKISNVVDNTQTISANQLPGTYYPVTCDWITSVDGYLLSTPAGINKTSKSAQFQSGTSPSFNAASGFKATLWTGDCAGTADGQACVIANIGGPKTCGATIIAAPAGGPFYNATSSTYYQTWAAAVTGSAANDLIKVSTDITDLTTAGSGGPFKLGSQWIRDAYTSTGYVPLTLTITGVAVIANDLVL